MSSFLKASVGKKFMVSISGLFMIMFLAVHLTLNLFLLAGKEYAGHVWPLVKILRQCCL